MRGRSAIGLTAILVLCACTSEDAADTLDVEMTTDATGATVSDTDHGLSAIVLQYREDEVRHVLSIKVRNAGPEPVRVVDLRLQWEGLEVVGPAPQDHLVGVGQALDLRTPYGDARCADDFSLDPPSTSSAFGEATIELSDGSTELVAIPIDDVEEQLVRLFRVDCRRQFIESVVTLELRGPWERIDPDGVATLRGALAVERRAGDRTITISDVDGSVLLDVRPAVPTSGPLLVLGPEDCRWGGADRRHVGAVRRPRARREQEDLCLPGRDRRRRRTRGRHHLAPRRHRAGDVPGDRRRLRALTRAARRPLAGLTPPGR